MKYNSQWVVFSSSFKEHRITYKLNFVAECRSWFKKQKTTTIKQKQKNPRNQGEKKKQVYLSLALECLFCVSVWGSYSVSPNIEETLTRRGSEETEGIGREEET